MSDYGNLMEENTRLKAEIERLKAELAAPKPGEHAFIAANPRYNVDADTARSATTSWAAAAEGADAGTLTGQPVDTHTHEHK